jgi:hypothetical protein
VSPDRDAKIRPICCTATDVPLTVRAGCSEPSAILAAVTAAASVPSSRGMTAYQRGAPPGPARSRWSSASSTARHSRTMSGLILAMTASSGLPRESGARVARFQPASAAAG